MEFLSSLRRLIIVQAFLSVRLVVFKMSLITVLDKSLVSDKLLSSFAGSRSVRQEILATAALLSLGCL